MTAPRRDGAGPPDETRSGEAFALLLGAVPAIAFLAVALRAPPGLQDDARMFLSWMGRWDDPELLRGDLVADYWQSVSPWFYRAVFRAAWLAGIEPLVFVRILPALLYPILALFAFRFLRAIGAEPFAALVATAALLAYVVDEGSVVNATPRGFWPALLLMVLDGLARRRVAQTALAQLCLAGSYPQMTLVTATVIGLTFLAPSRPLMLDLGRERIVLVLACAAATVAGILPFLLAAGGRFDPVVTLAEALRIPTFAAGGRNQIAAPNGAIGPFCGQRLGLFGNKCRGPLDPRFLVPAFFALAGPLALLARRARPGAAGRIRSGLPFLLLLASLGWFAAAHLVLFRLHLPSRYTAALVPMAILTALPLAIETLRRRWFRSRNDNRRRKRFSVEAGTVAAAGLALVGVAATRHPIQSPRDPQLVEAIRSLPKDAVVAGFVADLDFSPALTNRSTLFSRELTIGYQLGYLRPMMQRMEDMRDAVLTHEPAVLAERLRRNRVDVLLVDPAILADPKIPQPFRGFFGPDLDARERAAAQGGPTVLARLADRCATAAFAEVRALDARCLAQTTELESP